MSGGGGGGRRLLFPPVSFTRRREGRAHCVGMKEELPWLRSSSSTRQRFPLVCFVPHPLARTALSLLCDDAAPHPAPPPPPSSPPREATPKVISRLCATRGECGNRRRLAEQWLWMIGLNQQELPVPIRIVPAMILFQGCQDY